MWVRGKWVAFDCKSINEFYNVELVDDEAYQKLCEAPNYTEIIKCLTNDQGKWKLNSEGQVVNFKAKGLLYIPRVWHHFITSRIIPSKNVCEVTKARVMGAKRVIKFYALMCTSVHVTSSNKV